MTIKEYNEYKLAVKSFCDNENINSLDAITDNGNDETMEPFFSAVYCECCNSHVPGDRLDCIAYNEKDHQIYNYTVCLDCYYYFEYGQLDDLTMEEIEEDPLPGELYQITGGPGEKCLSNGNTWEESKITNNKKKGRS